MIKIDVQKFMHDHILFGFMRMDWPAHVADGIDVYEESMTLTKPQWYKVKNWRPWLFKRIR